MTEQGIHIEKTPQLRFPTLVAGFEGWGDAMGVSSGLASYLIRKLQARPFARLNPDLFFRYDENRPLITVTGGTLKSYVPPGGTFYAVKLAEAPGDLVILKSLEPALRWSQFADELLELARLLGIERIVTAGSMYDNVLHEDFMISAITTGDDMMAKLKPMSVAPVHYQGPGAIHSIVHREGQNRGFQCVSLWCHCPFYLQGTTHFGMLAGLTSLIAELGGFSLDVGDLEASWHELQGQIQELIDSKPELSEMIAKLRHDKKGGSEKDLKSARPHEKVINLKDFLEPK